MDVIEMAAIRSAALLSGDLAASIQEIRRGDPDISLLSGAELVKRSRAVADLLRFWPSQSAFDLRYRAGII
jgi:hypothetical protein